MKFKLTLRHSLLVPQLNTQFASISIKWLLLLLPFLFFAGCKKDIEKTGIIGVCPVVTATDPANNATGIAINKKITATFNEAMDVATINGSTFILMQGTSQVSGTVTYTDNTASF